MQETPPIHPPLVLASGSSYRADVLREFGINVVIDPPDVDERALDPLLADNGPDLLAVQLARLKARDVAARHPGSWVLAADQVALLERGGSVEMLTKQAKEFDAVAQLVRMSGTVHHLVGGLVLMEADSGRFVSGTDVHLVRMRDFSRQEALSYVQRFTPHDTAGSYRIEDSELMAPGQGLVLEVVGESPTGVLGMPIPLLRRLLGRAQAEWLGRPTL